MTNYTVVFYDAEPDEGGYWAEVLDLPGCVAQGEDLDELATNVREAVGASLETRRELDDFEEPSHVWGTWQIPVRDDDGLVPA